MNGRNNLEALRTSCLSLFAPTVIGVPGEVIESHNECLAPLFSDLGFFITRIDNLPVQSSESLFQNIAVACGFPSSFGSNWDALKDSLLDFSWMESKPLGFLLLYRHPELLNWADLSEFIILADRVRTIYAQKRKPFKLLLAHQGVG